jgi:LysM repeat protein
LEINQQRAKLIRMGLFSAAGAPLRAAATIFLTLTLALLVSACGIIGGGGSDSLNPNAQSVGRPGSVPTATPPATLPEPILLGAATDPIGGTNPQGTPTAGGTTGGAATYTVKPGDTLAAIAASQGVTGPDQAAWIVEVLRLNGIADARLLAAGQELSLPRQIAATNATPRPGTTTTPNTTPTRSSGTPGGPTQTPRSGATPSSGSTPSTGGGTTYVVQSGDTPDAIAAKLGVPAAQRTAWVTQLLQTNNVTAQTLQIGQTLTLPPIPR